MVLFNLQNVGLNNDIIIDTEFETIAQEIIYSQPQIPLMSNDTGE